MVEECCSTQLVDANGVFNVVGLENFVKRIKLADCGLSYAVVSIMGPQSSGKSTLLNHLFYTNFREMDAFKGRMQTTKGIWIARAVGIEPCTVVLDLEGTDGRESGDDDTAFEKQSALFALAISDIVLINMWCHDIGREHADNKPLLRTVFQVMMRLFTPRKTTLLFVIRDKTKTPFEYLEPILRDDTQKIWDAVPKPQAYKDTPLSEFFNVEVTAVPSYEEKEAQFKEQVSQLRQRFFNSIAPGGLTGDRRAVVPASGFSYSAHQIWKIIRENKDLDLPTHKVMVATVRCEEIANENFSRLSSDERWLALEEAVKSEPVSGLGKQLSMILETYFSEYDMETVYFDEGVRNIKRKLLESKALELIYPAYATMLGHLRVREYERFKTELEKSLSRGKRFAASVRRCKESCMLEFDRGCADATVQQADWDASKVREKLSWDIESYASSVRNTKLLEIISYYEKQLSDALGAPVESLLEAGRSDSWVSIRKLMQRESNTAILSFQSSIVGFELDQATCDQMVQELRDYARSIVEKKAREEAGKVLLHMKDKFSTVFYHDKDSMPRVWTGKEDIKTITRDACVESLRILSVMAVIRLEDKPDNIERILFSSLMHTKSTTPSEDLLASSNWDQISSRDTLITPTQCKYLWRQFKAEIEYTITQAISAQEAYKRSNNWLPPAWAILAMIILGLNEFMLLLRNPLCLIALFVVFLLSKAMWVQMDVSREFQNGVVAGLTSVASRFFPTMVNILTRLAGEGQQRFALESQTPASRPRSSTFQNESHGLSSVSSAASEMSGSSSISFMESSSDAGPRLTHRHARNIDAQVS